MRPWKYSGIVSCILLITNHADKKQWNHIIEDPSFKEYRLRTYANKLYHIDTTIMFLDKSVKHRMISPYITNNNDAARYTSYTISHNLTLKRKLWFHPSDSVDYRTKDQHFCGRKRRRLPAANFQSYLYIMNNNCICKYLFIAISYIDWLMRHDWHFDQFQSSLICKMPVQWRQNRPKRYIFFINRDSLQSSVECGPF